MDVNIWLSCIDVSYVTVMYEIMYFFILNAVQIRVCPICATQHTIK